MGVGVYPVTEKKIEGVEYRTDGKMLAKILDDATQRRAEQIGIKPLMNFGGFDPEEVFENFDLPESDEIKERWFSAEDGLQSVGDFLKDLTENPKLYSEDAKVTNGAIEDLRELQRILQTASAKNLKWYLAIDF